MQTVNKGKFEYKNTNAKILYNHNSTFVSPIYTFSLAGTIIVYMLIQGTNRDKYFIHIIYRGKNADSGGK